MTQETSTSVSSGAEAKTGAGGEDAKFVTPEDFEGFKSFINKEAQTRRKELSELRAELKGWQEAQESLKTTPPPTEKDKKGSDSLEAAETAREVKALKEKFEAAEKKAKDAIIAMSISDAVAGTKKELKDVLLGFLKSQARVEEVDGQSIVVVDGAEGPERLTPELIRKRHGNSWFPSSGKSGSGLNEGPGGAGSTGVDIDLAMKDQAYFEKNKDAVLAEIARRKKASE